MEFHCSRWRVVACGRAVTYSRLSSHSLTGVGLPQPRAAIVDFPVMLGKRPLPHWQEISNRARRPGSDGRPASPLKRRWACAIGSVRKQRPQKLGFNVAVPGIHHSRLRRRRRLLAGLPQVAYVAFGNVCRSGNSAPRLARPRAENAARSRKNGVVRCSAPAACTLPRESRHLRRCSLLCLATRRFPLTRHRPRGRNGFCG